MSKISPLDLLCGKADTVADEILNMSDEDFLAVMERDGITIDDAEKEFYKILDNAQKIADQNKCRL